MIPCSDIFWWVMYSAIGVGYLAFFGALAYSFFSAYPRGDL